MFVFTTKLSKKKLVWFAIAMGFVLGAIIMLIPEENAYDALSNQMIQAEMTAITVGGIKTNEDRIIFLNQRGLVVSEQEIEMKDVIIPLEFDEVYAKYNELQVSQGFNLEKFKGKTAEMYTYLVLNFDESKDETYANILIYDNKIIGGDISSSALDGEMLKLDQA